MTQRPGSPHRQRPYRLAAGLLLVSAVLVLTGLGVGSTGWGLPGVWGGTAQASTMAQIVWEIRLPRSVGAWLVGALLGLSGAMAQGLFRNPLADPYLLGSAAGAALGVTLALWASLMVGTRVSELQGLAAWAAEWGLTGAAFVGALAATAACLVLARGVAHTPRLLLAGVVVGVLLSAVTQALMWRWPQLLPPLQGFMLGSTSLLDARACWVLAAVGLACLGLGVALARGLDVLALGEATAQSMGLRLGAVRGVMVAAMALATGAAVAQAGLVAFVGLAAPHMVRSIVQVPHRWLLPLSALAGGVLLTVADLLARGLLAPAEWPVGVVTAFAGGSYLLWRLQQPGASRLGRGL